MAAEKFLASCYWFSRLVDHRIDDTNTEVAIISIYSIVTTYSHMVS